MIKNILNEQFKDLVSEETLNSIEEAFQQAVDEKASERIELENESLKQKLDEYYTAKLEELVESIDENHTAKLKKLVEAIDTDHAVKLQNLIKGIDKKHTGMLRKVVEKYETQLVEEAESFQSRLIEEVSNYLDLYLNKTIPTNQISEAVENIKAAKQLAQIRQIVGITEEFVDEEVKEALLDGKKIIDSLRAELNESIKENVALNQRANKAESTIVLEYKTSDMPSAKKQFVTKLLKDKTPQYIEENFSYVVDMFERESQEEVDEIKESVKNQFTKTPRIDRQIIEESEKIFSNEMERVESSDSITGYLNEMKNLSRFNAK
jgi:DNA-binding phage protein